MTSKRTAFQNFIEPIQTEATKKAYVVGLEAFQNFMKAKDFDTLLTKGTNDNIADFIQSLKDDGKAHKTIRIYLTAVKHFYVMNDVVNINWDKIRKFIGKVQTKGQDELYTREQIQTLLDSSRERERIAFLLMVSAGLRIGAIPSLKVGDLKAIENLFQVTVYRGTTSEYVTYCSPECREAIEKYLESRKLKGDTITENSPLLIQLGEEVKAVTLTGLISILNRALLDSRVRIEADDKYSRHNVPRFHSLRKYFHTALVKVGAKPVLAEMLMGHFSGLRSVYTRVDNSELLAEYVKAVALLTISNEPVLKAKVRELEVEQATVTELRDRLRLNEMMLFKIITSKKKTFSDAEAQELMNEFTKNKAR